MTAGLWVFDTATGRTRRPKSKKEVKTIASEDAGNVTIECTSLFGGFHGCALGLERGESITFVGPDPYTDRRFYGTLTRTATGVRVS